MSRISFASLVFLASVASAKDARVNASTNEISRVANDQDAKVRDCYQSALKVNPKLAGLVLVRWEISETGASVASIAKNETGSPELGSCLQKTLTGVQFPAPSSGNSMTLNWPYKFQAKE